MENQPVNIRRLPLIIPLVLTFLVYYFSNPQPQSYYDYTFRVAENFWHGAIGFDAPPPAWLNEFVPYDGEWYSVFPFGSVLTMLPFALLKVLGIVSAMPAALIAALSAGAICLFLLLIAGKYDYDLPKQILLTAAILFGTWMWANETMAGAWQLALGFALIGELGAIYFTVYRREPLIAGLFFALAFGNRTEILLTAPIFMFLLVRENFHCRDAETQSFEVKERKREKVKKVGGRGKQTFPVSSQRLFISTVQNFLLGKWKTVAAFCIFPLLLGVETLIYNYVRFDSPFDFGYARIPGVLDEPWYNHGIFSIYYIQGQAWEMLIRMWETPPDFPYFVPNGFSSSILFSSPFLFLLLRRGSRDKLLKYAAWTAIVILTFLLWIHGNSGGWQFGYRYAMVLLPWIFVVLLENSPKKITWYEWLIYGFSFVINAYAVYLFHWTNYIKP